MRELIQKLGSIKLTVPLLILICVALGAGTIIDSRQGALAARAVYYALWFHLLLGLFCVNLICSLIAKWPWGRQRIGFALTHSSMILILAGSLVSHLFVVEGEVAIWEGEQAREFVQSPSPGVRNVHPLPFAIGLEAFEIDTYPGTTRPAMFRSRVLVDDAARGVKTPAIIEMNRELSYGGFKFFQSSYRREPTRDMTILSVSRDPGMPIVFFGYTLLVVGMMTVLGTRIAQRRALHASGALPLLALAFTALAVAGSAQAAPVPPPDVVERVRRVPVQNDGRVMPFDTAAREAVRQVTGSEHWQGLDPVAVALGWLFHGEEWSREPLVRIGDRDLAAAVGLAGRGRGSFQELTASEGLINQIRRARDSQQHDRPLSSVEEATLELETRLVVLQDYLNRRVPTVLPAPQPALPWSVTAPLEAPQDLVTAAERVRAAIPPGLNGVHPARGGYPTPAQVELEVNYNRFYPSRVAWWILLPATILSALSLSRPQRLLSVAAFVGLALGFAVMSWGIWARWQVGGRIPASNMYESLLFLAWGVGLFALIAAIFIRQKLLILNATAMSALTMLLVDRLPIDPFIHPMPPVLSGTPWLAIHVPIIMVSYSVLALGVVVAHMQVGLEISGKVEPARVARMNDLLYWYMFVGSILLIAGILTGSIWASSSWGRYWGWDPKEVWSLIAFLAYMGILHGRLDHIIGRFGVAVASIAAFWMILMTYIGVNYVLATGLHSYGFGSSKIVQSMGLVLLAEVIFLTIGWLGHRRNGRTRAARRAAA